MNKSLKAPTIPSAVQWAKFFMANKQEHNWTIDSINENLLIGYFANFWACAVDPLNARIDEMQATITRQQTALDAVRKFRSDMRNLASVPQPESERARGFDAAHRLFDKAIREALSKADGGDV